MFEFQLVTDNIARLQLEFKVADLISSSVAVWLVRTPEGFVQIDSGPPQTAGDMVEAVSEATHGKGPKVILLTHGHLNHAGGLSALRLAWNPPIAAHAQEAPYIVGSREYSRIRSGNPLFWLGSILMESTSWSIPNVSQLNQGQTVLGLNVIHLPGHTPGHLGFIHVKDQACICGDAVLHLGRRLMPPFALTTPNTKLAKNSIFRLTERNFQHLLPSHGPPLLKIGRQRLFEYARKRAGKKAPNRTKS
jgi:glyoxylase-like metal-dependent hydrolase (beta-lactamase superfamily II)